MTAVEACRPVCPHCGNFFQLTRLRWIGWVWKVCDGQGCGWRGLMRCWREQE